MTDICRLCASLKRLDHLITIADPSLSVKNKLLRCCQVELSQSPLLPQNICTDCGKFLAKGKLFIHNTGSYYNITLTNASNEPEQ